MAKNDALARREETALLDGLGLIKAVAMDIGKEVASHIETMYPEAVSASASTFLLSVRNCTYNKIMAALNINADNIGDVLARHDKHRRHMRKAYKEIRKERPRAG